MATFIEALLPSVHDTLSLREALSKIAQCERNIKSQGVCSIIDNFNIVYSCLCNVTHLKTETLDEIMNILIRGLQLLESDLKKLLSEKMSTDTRISYLNTLKILIYLTVEFSNYLEKKFLSSKENELLTQTNKKSSKKTNTKKVNPDLSINESESLFDWNNIKEKVLAILVKIVDLSIQKLWEPPIVEEQFVITLTNLCYKLMETCQSNSIRQQQRKVIKDHLCHILAIMIKKYNHSYSACVMIVQTLPHYEHFSSVYADLIQTCVIQQGYESIMPDILREFSHANLSTGTGNKENPNLKYYSQFLIELADRLASQFLPYLSLVQEFQDEESYLMRNSVLYIYGEILIKVLNKENMADLKSKQARDELLDHLMDHIHDTNAVARSKTLQIWRRLSEENCIPLNYINELMRRCVGRMEDVASSVRKSAFQLLCDLIRKNPFGIKSVEMSLEQINGELSKEEDVLNELNKESDKLIEELNNLVEPKNSKVDCQNEASMDELSQNDVELQAQKEKHDQMVLIQKSKVNYLKDMLGFVNQIETAIPKLSKLLFSKTQTDVLEVISFFVTCYEHGFTDMLFGIRKMLALVVNSEKTVKDAVINAYKRLYLKSESRQPPIKIAKQLLKLAQDLSICERGALEELIGEFVINGELDGSVIQILWEIFSDLEKPALTRFHSILLLSMIIKRIPGKGKANIQVLIDFGLKLPTEAEATDLEMLIYSETCLALSCISPDVSTKQLTQQEPSSVIRDTGRKTKKTKSPEEDDEAETSYVQPRLQFKNEPFKLVNSHQLFERLSEILTCQLNNLNTTKWTPMMENAIACIFKLADNPIILIEHLILKLMDQIGPFKHLISNKNSTQDEHSNAMVNSLVLTRFYNVIGVVATKLLVFLNQFVVCELKRRKMCKENKENQKLNSKNSKSRRKSIRSNKSLNRQSLGGFDANLEEDMGLQGAEAEDAELMFIESVIDQKVALSNAKHGVNSLLAQQMAGIVFILREQSKYPDSLVLTCAMTFVRLMALSRKLCTDNLQLLFTLMEKSPNPKIRSQLIIGIGDLVYRFPNALEPWTSHLYLPLRDTKSPAVRMNTIRVLSHLILKEMIKTRGQIFEIALCTIDENSQISSLAKLFFSELSQRNNGLVIYNAMPDIISQLSGGGGGVSNSEEIYAAREITEESFRQIVTYLFTFIKRDKQCETLIEKLCHGFRQANISERKCRDLVFCLSKVQLSENGIKKLKETFKWYADKLIYQSVYDTFKNTILKNARKLPMLRNEAKLLIDELEKQIDEVKQKGLADEPSNDISLREETAGSEEMSASEADAFKSNKKSAAKAKIVAKQSQKLVKKNPKSNVTRNRRNVVESSSEQSDDPSKQSDSDSSTDCDSD